MGRRPNTRETWHRLLEWDQGSAAAERLASVCLEKIGYKNIDPQHPLGGPDGGKDIKCTKDGKPFVCAVYFPRGKQSFQKIKEKIHNDAKAIQKHNAHGIVFFTNQELTLSERSEVEDLLENKIDIVHLEIISTLLNRPYFYGVRLEFLQIEMEKEEQLSFYSSVSSEIQELKGYVIELLQKQDAKRKPTKTPTVVYPEPIENLNSFGSSLFRQMQKLHFCSKCNYGYIIQNDSMRNLGMTSIFSSSINFGGFSITCPNCGNTEHYRDYYSI